jgi:cell division septation protein DedD
MSRIIRVVVYALIVLVLYYVIHEIIRVYNKASVPLDTELDGTDTMDNTSGVLDTLVTDSLSSDELITNEEIVGGGSVGDISETVTPADQPARKPEKLATPVVKKSEAPAKTKPVVEEKPVKKAPVKTKTPEKTEKKKNSTAQKKPAIKPEPKPQPVKQQPVKTADQPGDGGKYLVMAGSYLLRDNATKMVKKLREMGYINAEVVIFPESEFHSVIAVRYASETKAQGAVTELKRKGIESFVKVK